MAPIGAGAAGAPPPSVQLQRDRLSQSWQAPQLVMERPPSRNSRQTSRSEQDYQSMVPGGPLPGAAPVGSTPRLARPASRDRSTMEANNFMGGPNLYSLASASTSSPQNRIRSPQPQPRPRDVSARRGRDLPSRTSLGSASVTTTPDDEHSRTYIADTDDLLDQHVAYYFRHHPEVYMRHRISRKRPGIYELDGREIEIEWQYGTMPGEQGCLVAVDGPLRQPFSNYMEQSEANAEYLSHGLQRAALHSVPRVSRMTFDDKNKAYTRLEAMKVAKEQALIREKAAEYAQRGVTPPVDLRHQYEKSLARKLHPGGKQRFSNRPAAPPAMMPGPPTYMPGAPSAPMPPGPSGYPAVGHVMQGIPPMTTVMAQPAGPNFFGTPNLYGDMKPQYSSPPPGAFAAMLAPQ